MKTLEKKIAKRASDAEACPAGNARTPSGRFAKNPAKQACKDAGITPARKRTLKHDELRTEEGLPGS